MAYVLENKSGGNRKNMLRNQMYETWRPICWQWEELLKGAGVTLSVDDQTTASCQRCNVPSQHARVIANQHPICMRHGRRSTKDPQPTVQLYAKPLQVWCVTTIGGLAQPARVCVCVSACVHGCLHGWRAVCLYACLSPYVPACRPHLACLYVRLHACMPIRRVCLAVRLPVRMSVRMCACVSVRLRVGMSVCVYVRRFGCMYISLSVCLSVCPPVCMYVCLLVCQSVGRSVRSSVGLYVCLSVCLSICLSVGQAVCLSTRLPVCICARMSVCMHVDLHGCVHVCMYTCPSVNIPGRFFAQ